MLFFLRFLLGSTNQLWLEYVHREEIDPTPVERQNALIAMDIGFLTVFGIFAAAMLYANTVVGFLGRAVAFLAFAPLWTIVAERYIRPRISRNTSSIGDWGWWSKMDFVQLAFFLVAWFLSRCEAGGKVPGYNAGCESLSLGYLPVAGWSVVLSILILASASILAWDFVFQLRQLSKNSVPTPPEESPSPRLP